MMRGSLLILVPGTVLGFMVEWWAKGWIRTSLGLLIALGMAQFLWGSSYFNRLSQTWGCPGLMTAGSCQPLTPLPEAELPGLISHSRPRVQAGIGFGGMSLSTG